MSSFEPNKRHFWELLIYSFNLKKSVAEAHRLFVEKYGEAALSKKSCEWFQKFMYGEFDIEDKERGGRPKVYEEPALEALLDQDSGRTQDEQYNVQHFEWSIRFRSFTINAQFLIKNGGNLFVHLIIKRKKKIIIIIFFFEEGRNALCTVKGTQCSPGVWDSAAHAALPTKTPSLSLVLGFPPRNRR